MQYRLFAAAASFAASAYAQYEADRASSEAVELFSVVSVLQTALPSSLIQNALTNSAGVSSEIVSDFAAGNTPSWFAELPSDVQTYLVPTGFFGPANATAITSASGMPTNSANASMTGNSNSTLSRSTLAVTETSTVSTTSSTRSTRRPAASARGDDEMSSSSEAGASLPTAMVGMGIAGVAGLVGVLAL